MKKLPQFPKVFNQVSADTQSQIVEKVYEKITYTVKNMVANLTGMICDGAKPGCSMKLTSGVSTAVFSALIAMQGHTVAPCEGITDGDVDQCIRNLSRIGTHGMRETDSYIFDMMFRKHRS